MKTIYFLFAVCLVCFFISITSFLNENTAGHKISFSISETPAAFKLKISYHPDKAPQVEKYIDSCLYPEVVFGNMHKINKEVITADQLQFHIKGTPGTLYLTADKRINSASSLDKIRQVCKGLKSVH